MYIEWQLRRFVSSKYTDRKWLKTKRLEVYVRKDEFSDKDGIPRKTLVIANSFAYPRGKGRFTNFLDHAEKRVPWDIYIETVNSERLRNFYRRRRYEEIKISTEENAPSHFIKHAWKER